jgi:hypothetical protein
MNIQIEFTGFAQALVGQKVISLSVEMGTNYRGIVKKIGQEFPGLVGLLIDDDGETFLSGNMFIINGNLETPAFVMDEVPNDGEHLVLMSLVTGG